MTPVAHPPAAAGTAGKYLIIALGGEAYGIAVLSVREMIRMQPITPVARVPAYIRGVINLRGRVIPVIDLRIKMGLPAELSKSACIVVVQVPAADGRHVQMGVVVDSVEEVMNVSAAQIEPAPDFGARVSAPGLLGMAKVRERVVTLLAIDRVVTADGFRDLTAPQQYSNAPP